MKTYTKPKLHQLSSRNAKISAFRKYGEQFIQKMNATSQSAKRGRKPPL